MPDNWVPFKGYIGLCRDIWGLGFRVKGPCAR